MKLYDPQFLLIVPINLLTYCLCTWNSLLVLSTDYLWNIILAIISRSLNSTSLSETLLLSISIPPRNFKWSFIWQIFWICINTSFADLISILSNVVILWNVELCDVESPIPSISNCFEYLQLISPVLSTSWSSS